MSNFEIFLVLILLIAAYLAVLGTALSMKLTEIRWTLEHLISVCEAGQVKAAPAAGGEAPAKSGEEKKPATFDEGVENILSYTPGDKSRGSQFFER